MSPLVSLVITTHNREQFLADAIASVLQQTYPNFELLVWDDGSTDRSVAVAQAYAQQDRRVRVVAAAHRGRVAALSRAIAHTRGTYLGWVDSDDWLAPTALQETVRVLNTRPTVGMVYTDYINIDEQGRAIGYGQRCATPYSKERLLVEFMTFHFRLMRRSIYYQVGGIDHSLDFVEDYDLCLKLSEVTLIDRVRQPLYHYRIHANSASHQLNLEQTLRTHTILKQALKRRGMANSHAIDLELSTSRFTLRQRQLTTAGVRSRVGGAIARRAACSSNFRTIHFAPLLATIPIIGAVHAGSAQAQSIAPATDGTNTIVTPAGNRLDITGGTPSSNGANLFHSFERFGLTQGQIANFLAHPQLQNILGRVVGNTPSIIDGLIQITGGTPNLYLLNPAGIVFGANANLNVPAAFTATTANGIGFGCGVWGSGCSEWFSASGSNNYAALNGVPGGFAFTTSQPGAIVNAGNLAVGQGQAIALIGGTVINTGTLTAPGGQILISAVPGESLVRLSQPGNLLSLEIQAIGSGSFSLPTPHSPLPAPSLPQLLTGGNLTNATGLTVNPDGTVRLTSGITVPTTPGTAIVSGQLSLTPSSPSPSPLAPPPAIAILGDRVGILGATIDASGSNEAGSIYIGGDYQGKGTLPTAKQTLISQDSTITANATQMGNGGRVIVWANQNTDFRGTIAARGGVGGGNGGLVEVSGKETLKFRGEVDVSAANGQAGTLLLDPVNITIVAAGGVNDSEVNTDGQILFGDGGAASFTISQTALEGLVGTANVILQASNNIIFESLADNVLQFNPGTGFIQFEAGGTIAMNTSDTIFTFGRNISFTGGNLALGTINTSASGAGNGGNITLQATGNITTGNLTANALATLPGAPAQGGAINVTSATGTIAVGNISSTVANGFGYGSGNTVTLRTEANGGDISFQTIDTRGVSAFVADARAGGDVVISARGQVRGVGQLATGDTIATSGTDSGSNGTVTITHDGGPANQPFTIATGSITATTGNGTASSINTGSELLSGQTLGFPSSPFTSPGNSVRVTFTNAPPIINAVSPLPPTVPNQPVSVSVAALGLSIADLNADNPLFIRVFSVAPGAVLRINGVTATPGAIVPPDATLEFIPPPEFVGVLSNAFSLTVDDGISISSPRAIALTVNNPSTPVNNTILTNPCVLTTCQIIPPDFRATATPTEVVLDQLPEDRFTQEFAAYLGITETNVASIAEQREVLRQIERETGAKPALIYVSFVPAFLNAASQVKMQAPAIAERADDQLEVLMVTAQGDVTRRRIAGVTRAIVTQFAKMLRLEVADSRRIRTTSYLRSAQQLYRWLIAAIEPELKLRQINNLVFLMDTELRSLPLAALHDGKQFLVERYSVGLMPSLSLTDTRFRDIKEFQLLSLGISEAIQDLSPLPSVPLEVATIAKLWQGQAFLDQKATLATLKSARQAQPYGIVHLATHADFRPGSLDNSFIQLWDDRLRLDQLNQLGWNNPQVQLLVLSACSTALGDREAELGFAGLAVQAGVKSAIASLWAVNDVGTAALITRFYKDLQTAPIKAEALRQAQLAMIRGSVYIQDNQIQGVEPTGLPLPEDNPFRNSPLSHPYFWSAFTMIGNPW